MFYRIMRVLVRFAFKVYFRKMHIIGVDKIPKQGALLMAPNHPSAFMEACLLACFQPRSLYFLVRGDVFNNPRFLPFLRGTHQVPIFRAQDGFSNLRRNEETFRYCYATLGLKRTVVIFPERGTVWEKKLRPIQRGAAKIAFGAMDKHPGLDLKIIPVGVNFEDPRKFQSDVVVRFGDPIDARDYHVESAEVPQKAVQDLTGRIEDGLRELVHDVRNAEQEASFDMALELYRNTYYLDHFPIVEQDIKRFRDENRLAKLIRSGHHQDFLSKLDAYRANLEARGMSDDIVMLSRKPGWKLLMSVLFSTPVWVAGLVVSAWPALASRKITTAKMKDQAFVGPVQLSLGILLYLLVILLLLIVLPMIFGWIGPGIVVFLVALAYFVSRTWHHHISRWKALVLKIVKKTELKDLAGKRDKLILQMNELL